MCKPTSSGTTRGRMKPDAVEVEVEDSARGTRRISFGSYEVTSRRFWWTAVPERACK